CKYNGGNNLRKACRELSIDNRAILVCPEIITTLGCPREAAEIIGYGGGQGVWSGTARVITVSGVEVTEQFKEGALATLEMIKANTAIEMIVLQSRSPSCGVNTIYDGSFTGQLVPGDGVLVSLLKQHGIPVIDVEEFLELEREMKI
ncbi:MAG: DUF523 domain-containing protein, partial [Methylocystaceae bacterium]